MRVLLPVLSVLLALLAAGSIIYLAWELVREAERRHRPERGRDADGGDDGAPEGERPEGD